LCLACPAILLSFLCGHWPTSKHSLGQTDTYACLFVGQGVKGGSGKKRKGAWQLRERLKWKIGYDSQTLRIRSVFPLVIDVDRAIVVGLHLIDMPRDPSE